MSIALFSLISIGLLAVTWSVCFVGCSLQTHGLGETTPYSNEVLSEPSLLAYWPLNDAQSSGTPLSGNLLNSFSFGTATDFSPSGGHDGTYLVPPAYPQDPMSESFSGALSLGPDASIVPGDISGTTEVDKLINPGSTDFEGGYVSIPWSAGMQKAPQLSQFTFEAWIRPHWTSTGLVHVLFGALAADNTGFVIAIDNSIDPTKNLLQVIVGTGMTTVAKTSDIAIDPTITTYVAVTGDMSSANGTFKFYTAIIDGMVVPGTPISATNYVATDPTQQQLTFFIGAGRNDQPPRTQPGAAAGAPLFPFLGQIQSVALYGGVLDQNELQQHFSDGTFG